MLDAKNAREVIDQLQSETFLCNDDAIVTNNYIIIKKSSGLSTDNVLRYVKKIRSKSPLTSNKEGCKCILCGKIVNDGRIFPKKDDPKKGICFDCW